MIRDGRFAAQAIIVDGYDFVRSTSVDLEKFKDFAARMDLEVWFSASLKGEEPLFDERGFPRELDRYLEAVDVLLTLRHQGDRVQFHLVKDHDFPSPGQLELSLDPISLLIAEP
jgi:hypothetical protein